MSLAFHLTDPSTLSRQAHRGGSKGPARSVHWGELIAGIDPSFRFLIAKIFLIRGQGRPIIEDASPLLQR